ncbi:putative membrane protein [Kineosphaera limosa]|uniref:DUF202 domain-containing protein n=1 Tax=Kineosphaera limosa NBRC 100340 TaxID=1184609 RepID=K6VNQ8_9MICO|nr:DUF202 domain-containing protein [Kineosphaera limosa]NYE00757.1 putative membrane protein [Kineosphaera limosa]GAB97833.1 hypothetical protein KILIM_084_00050 [Kineosphaera limosa NBRC 100340]
MSTLRPGGRRFPRSVYGVGTEPDPRFSLANERTFLAWIGVALAVFSVAVGIESLAVNLEPTLRTSASLVLMVAGLGCAAQAWWGWRSVERALRLSQPLPGPRPGLWLTAALSLVGVLLLASVVLS